MYAAFSSSMEMDARNVEYDPDVMLFEIVNKMVPVFFFFFLNNLCLLFFHNDCMFYILARIFSYELKRH